jgi:hypothetical protein
LPKRFLKKGGLAFVSVLIGGLAVAGTTALMPVRQACAQRGQMSYKEDIVPIFK